MGVASTGDGNGVEIIHHSAFDATVLDPGDRAVAAFQLEQARRFQQAHPNTSSVGGVLIDRVDWTGLLNTKADDGISWNNLLLKPARLLLRSFYGATAALQQQLDQSGHQVWMSPKVYRPDLTSTADGMYSENGDYPEYGLVTSFLGAGGKPLSAWFGASPHRDNPTDHAGIRRYLQGLLHAGVLPTVPFP